jgi:hypothetical protein
MQVLVVGIAANAFSPRRISTRAKPSRSSVGGGPGGSGEFQTRALVKFLEKYIPGKPHIMVEFIEGAAGRKSRQCHL